MPHGDLLVLMAGHAVEPVLARRGDFDALFRAALPDGAPPVRVVAPADGEPLPPLGGLAGVIVSGSADSVTDETPWMAETAGWLLGAAHLGLPLLGVCFGHQLVAHAFGGQVIANPRGREMGTAEVALTDAGRADPLFEGLPDPLVVQQSHRDVVALLPPDARILARNPMSEVQAFAIGDNVRAVQFHPEFDAEVMQGYLDARADLLRAEAEAEGRDPDAALRALRQGLRDGDHGRRLLAAWVARFVAP